MAESMKADVILLDEKAARRVAAHRGLRVTGLLGVLGEAATRGLVDPALAIDRLRTTSFRSSPALLKATLDRFGNDRAGATVLPCESDNVGHFAADLVRPSRDDINLTGT